VPVALQDHALDSLRYIRDAMSRAGAFTAVPGWGGVIMGVTALGAAVLAGPPSDSARWLGIWLGEAALASAIALVAITRKARRSGVPLFAAPTRRFALAYAPPMVAGAVLTAVFVQNGLGTRLPGCWLLLYGVAVVTGGAWAVRIVPVMGLCFMTLGLAAFVAPAPWGHYFMAAGFGGVHVGFGLRIAKEYGG